MAEIIYWLVFTAAFLIGLSIAHKATNRDMGKLGCVWYAFVVALLIWAVLM